MPDATILAFDFGRKRIGVAIGNTIVGQARALTTISASRKVDRDNEITALIREWQPQESVVGLPVHMDGTEHEITQGARAFAVWLGEQFSLPVHLVDERLTTQAAQSVLEESGVRGNEAKAVRDAVAAQIILQAYLDERSVKAQDS